MSGPNWYWRDGSLATPHSMFPEDENYDKEKRLVEMDNIEKKLRDPKYKIVKQTILPNKKWVSTVWIGLDHNFSPSGKPLIFETMVFPKKGDFSDLDCERYSTEAQAKKGHEKVCKEWSKK